MAILIFLVLLLIVFGCGLYGAGLVQFLSTGGDYLSPRLLSHSIQWFALVGVFIVWPVVRGVRFYWTHREEIARIDRDDSDIR